MSEFIIMFCRDDVFVKAKLLRRVHFSTSGSSFFFDYLFFVKRLKKKVCGKHNIFM